MKKKIDFDKITKFVKKKNFLIACCVLVLTIGTLGYSYGAFFSVKTNTNNQTVTTGTLNVSYTNASTSMDKGQMQSMSDEMGLNETDNSLIYIQNTGSLDSNFTLTVGYDMANFTSRSGYKETDELTPLDYVMVAVYEHSDGTDTLVVEPTAVAELPLYEVNSNDSRYNRYAILFDTVGSTSSGNATKTYKVKMWLSDKAIPAASFTYFYLNAEIIAEVENAKMAYNLSGTVTDSSSTALNGAVVSIQNGSVTSQTDASGNFTLNGIYPGTYNLDITYNGITYKGNLTVVEGTANNLVSNGTTFNSTSDIFSVANTYKTTIAKIISLNDIDTYSTEVAFASGTTYNLAPTYTFTGGGTEAVNGLNISLDTSNQTYSLTLN